MISVPDDTSDKDPSEIAAQLTVSPITIVQDDQATV